MTLFHAAGVSPSVVPNVEQGCLVPFSFRWEGPRQSSKMPSARWECREDATKGGQVFAASRDCESLQVLPSVPGNASRGPGYTGALGTRTSNGNTSQCTSSNGASKDIWDRLWVSRFGLRPVDLCFTWAFILSRFPSLDPHRSSFAFSSSGICLVEISGHWSRSLLSLQLSMAS